MFTFKICNRIFIINLSKHHYGSYLFCIKINWQTIIFVSKNL